MKKKADLKILEDEAVRIGKARKAKGMKVQPVQKKLMKKKQK